MPGTPVKQVMAALAVLAVLAVLVVGDKTPLVEVREYQGKVSLEDFLMVTHHHMVVVVAVVPQQQVEMERQI